MKTNTLWLFFVPLLLGGCHTSKSFTNEANDYTSLYGQSILSAMAPGPGKIYDNLVSITAQNEGLVWKKINNEDYLLMVSWKQDTTYYKPNTDEGFYNTGKYPIWVTTSPELVQRMEREKSKDLNLRLKQLLGLPPNAVYNYFIEFWVKPEDLFRPCPDSEITDSRCDLFFPDDTDPGYISWINENRIDRYYQRELFSKYPWTQLGYTYDWNKKNKSHVGVSEFVIPADKNIIINGFYPTEAYLGSTGKKR